MTVVANDEFISGRFDFPASVAEEIYALAENYVDGLSALARQVSSENPIVPHHIIFQFILGQAEKQRCRRLEICAGVQK